MGSSVIPDQFAPALPASHKQFLAIRTRRQSAKRQRPRSQLEGRGRSPLKKAARFAESPEIGPSRCGVKKEIVAPIGTPYTTAIGRYRMPVRQQGMKSATVEI